MKKILIVLFILLTGISSITAQDRETTLSNIDTGLPSSSKLSAAQLRTALKAIVNSAFDGIDSKVNVADLVNPYLYVYRQGQVDTLLTTNTGNVAVNSTFPSTGNVFINSTNNKQYYFSGNYWRNTALTDSTIATTGYLDGLVAAYEFDETTGTTIKDWVKGAPNGTIYGNTLINQTGKIGKAIYLDGTGDYIDCTNSTKWNFTNSFTVMCWVKAETPVTSNAYIFAKVTAGDVRSYSVWTSTNANNYFWKSDNSDYIGSGSFTPSLITAWTHIAITFNGSAISLYRNGVLISTTATTGVFPTTTVSMLIGGLSTTANFYKGWIDQMCFFNTVKTADDFLYYYNSGSGRAISTWAR